MIEELPEYIQDAKFIKPGLDVDEELWPRDPNIYEPSEKFISRFKQFGSTMDGDIIEDAIKYGELYTASRGCVAFVNNLEGVAFYIIVAKEVKPSFNKDKDIATVNDYNYRGITIWPYVYNREMALDTGRWSSRHLNQIEELAHGELEDHIDEYRQYTDTE